MGAKGSFVHFQDCQDCQNCPKFSKLYKFVKNYNRFSKNLKYLDKSKPVIVIIIEIVKDGLNYSKLSKMI